MAVGATAMNNSPKISVIVPIYNVEKYLKQCLDSILIQTYKNLEIILVNDGSTDNSLKICEEYCKKDRRFKLINKRNGGLSDARNVAIDVASGKYLICIDSDDYISKDLIATLYMDIKNNQSDIAVSGFLPVYDNMIVEDDFDVDGLKIFNTEEALETMLYQKDCTTSAWGKLYKTSLFEGIRYPKGKICEDLDTTYKLFDKADIITIRKDKMYYYRQRKNSIIKQEFSPSRMDSLDFAKKETTFIKEKYPRVARSAVCREFMEAIYILAKLNGETKRFQKEYNTVKDAIKTNRFTVLLDNKAPKKFRACALISYFGILTLQLVVTKRTMMRTRR